MAPDKSKYITTCFIEASRLEQFHNRWMSADIWAKLLTKYSLTTPEQSTFDGSGLERCILSRKNRWLQDQMDLRSNITIDHVGIFREKLRRKGAKNKKTTIMLQLKEIYLLRMNNHGITI